MTAKSCDGLTDFAEVLKEALRTWLYRLARGVGACKLGKDRGSERAAVVRNIVADMVAVEALETRNTLWPTTAS